jgi:ferredoxin
MSVWCLAPLLAAPLLTFLLRSTNPPALGSLVWLKGALAGLAVLPAVWHPYPHDYFWHFSPAFLLAGTGAALGGTLAAIKPGPFRVPLAPAAFLAALMPLAFAWLSGPSAIEPPPPADILIFGERAGAPQPAAGPPTPARPPDYGESAGNAQAPDNNPPQGYVRAPDYNLPQGYGQYPGYGEAPGRPAAAGRGRPVPAQNAAAASDPAGTELAAVLALAPLFLFLIAVGEAPRLPALVFCAGLAALALLKGSMEWGASVFWTATAFLVLPELLLGPRKALMGLMLWAPGAYEIAASGGWSAHGGDLGRLTVLGWFTLLGIISWLLKIRELRRLQAAAVRALLLSHPLALRTMPGGAVRAPSGSPRAPAAQPPPLTAAVLCRRSPDMPRTASPPGLTCAVLDSISGGPWACAEGCLGAGDCIAACPSGALSAQDWGCVPEPDPERCNGCGLCVIACPKGLVRLVPRAWKALVPCRGRLTMKAMDALCPGGCLGCGLCRKACPKGALAWTPPAFAARPHAGRAAPSASFEAGLARGPRGGAKPAVVQDICLDSESGACDYECRKSCPRNVILTR